jgi:hypothetical protein
LRRDIDQFVAKDTRAWDALVELSGEARARRLVEQARERLGVASVSQSAEVNHAGPAVQPAPHKKFAQMSAQEKAARRKEFFEELRRNAGVSEVAPGIRTGR